MISKVFSTAAVILVMSSLATAAQQPTPIQQFNAWGSYSYDTAGGKVCFILSQPTEKSPASVDHGDIFFLVSQKPGQNVSYEPQVKMGYTLRAGSKVNVVIDGKTYSLFTKDDSAWMENAAEEPQLVAALRNGRSMTVAATSQRGTATNYKYSLSGVTAALKSISTCR